MSRRGGKTNLDDNDSRGFATVNGLALLLMLKGWVGGDAASIPLSSSPDRSAESSLSCWEVSSVPAMTDAADGGSRRPKRTLQSGVRGRDGTTEIRKYY